jgi:hypothetical protein
MNFIKIILLFLMIFFYANSHAQVRKNSIQQNMFWVRYCNQLELNKKWSIHSEIDNRAFLKNLQENLYLVRLVARYKISEHVDAGIGFAYFSVKTQNPSKDDRVSLFYKPEYRVQQDIIIKQVFSKINVSHRYQIEERFFRNYDENGLTAGTTFNIRCRYRLLGDHIFWKNKKQFIKGIAYDEIMINVGNKIVRNIFDQNRIYAGVQYGICPSVSVELGYLNSFQQLTTGIDYFERNIIRCSIYHKIKL